MAVTNGSRPLWQCVFRCETDDRHGCWSHLPVRNAAGSLDSTVLDTGVARAVPLSFCVVTAAPAGRPHLLHPVH